MENKHGQPQRHGRASSLSDLNFGPFNFRFGFFLTGGFVRLRPVFGRRVRGFWLK